MNVIVNPIRQKILTVIMILMGLLVAIFVGLISTTANPILIGLSLALIAGGALIAYPVWVVWIILSLGLLITGMLPLYFDAITSKMSWGVSLLGFLLLALALIKIVMSSEIRKSTPAFVWISLAFIVYAVINTILQYHSLSELLTGVKRYFQVWGLLFALCWIPFDSRDIQRWRIFLVITALLQLPASAYERIVFVPIREVLKSTYPGIVPMDVVAGTFGTSLTGGGASGEMVIFLLIALAFLLARQKEKLLPFSKLFLLAPIILIPIFIGEVKAIIVLFPLFFIVQYRSALLTHFHYWLLGAIALFFLMIIAIYSLLQATGNTEVSNMIDNSLRYNVEDAGYGRKHLNRTTVITFWYEKNGLHNPVAFIFGNGVGSAHTATGGRLSQKFDGYGIDLTAISTLLWEQGIFGLLLFCSIFLATWRCAGKLRQKTLDPMVRADASAIQTGLALFVFYLFYRNGMLENLSMQIIFATMLGYLSWLYRMDALGKETKPQRVTKVIPKATFIARYGI